MKKIYLCTAIAMTLLTACQENETLVTVTPTETNDTEVVISATIDESTTRTHLSESDNGKRHVLWDASDNVAVFYGYDKPSKFTVKSGENTTYAQFSTRKIEKGNAIDHYVGLYPYDADATITYATEYNYTTYTVTTTFPAEQSYQENSYGVGAAPMMAVSTSNSSLSFKNMCTSVKINLKGTQKVSRIEIISLDEDKPIAGKYRYTLPQEYYDFEDRIKIEPVAGEAVNMITLDCGEGVQLNTETATGFIFTMPPREFDDDELLFRVYYAEGGFADVYKQEGFTYQRSKVVSIGGEGYECDEEEVCVATIGTESFATVADALKAFEEASAQEMPEANLSIHTDILLGDAASQANSRTRSEAVLGAETITRDQITIPAGKTLTLNLNGHSIRGEKACTESFQMIDNKGTLIITGNGTISFKDTSAGDPSYGWGSYTIRNEGTLIVENGTIEHLGEQTQHMFCAIFQYCGSTTINGGTISTPNYRSARLWMGDMTINGGNFEGQLWVQAVDNTAELTINGGTFAPRGGDGSSVFITNDQRTVGFTVTGGYFNTKIGSSNTTNFTSGSGMVTGGTFTEAAKTNTKAELLATGYQFVANGDGTYDVKK